MKFSNTTFTHRLGAVLLSAFLLVYGGCGGDSSYTEYSENDNSSSSSEGTPSSSNDGTSSPGTAEKTPSEPPKDSAENASTDNGNSDSSADRPSEPASTETRPPREERQPAAQNSAQTVNVAEDFPMLASWNTDLGDELSREFRGKTYSQCSELTIKKMAENLKQMNAAVKMLQVDQYAKFPENLLKACEMQYSINNLRDLHQVIWAKNSDPGKARLKNERVAMVGRDALDIARTATDNDMPRLAADMAALPENVFKAPMDIESLVKEYAATVQNSGSTQRNSSSSSDDYSYGDDYDSEYSSGSSSGTTLYQQAANALQSLTSGNPDAKTVVPVLKSLANMAKAKFQETGNSSEDGYSSSSSLSSRSTSSNRSGSGRTGSGISLDAPPETASGTTIKTPDVIPGPMIELLSFGLKKLNHSDNPEIAKESIRAYCALTEEDIVPEIMAIIYDDKQSVDVKRAACEAMVYDPKYRSDPRIAGIFVEYLEHDTKWTHVELDKLAKNEPELGLLVARISIGKTTSRSIPLRNAALLLIAAYGDATCAPALEGYTSSNEQLEVRQHAIEAMGRIGDEKVASCLTKLLSDTAVRDVVINALFQLDHHAELAISEMMTRSASSRNSFEQAELDEIGLEILATTGTWNSLRYVAFVLNRYGTAAGSEKLNLNETQLNNLVYACLTAGSSIISRMTGTQMPTIKKPAAITAQGNVWSSEDSGSTGRNGSSGSSSSRSPSRQQRSSSSEDGENLSPLDFTPPAGDNPYHWTMNLLNVATENAEKGFAIISKAKTAATAETAGTEYKNYDNSKDMIEPAIDQALEHCITFFEDDPAKQNVFKPGQRKYTSAKSKRDAAAANLMKNTKLWESFNKNYKATTGSGSRDR